MELCPGCARREVDTADDGLCASCTTDNAIVDPGLTRAQVDASIERRRYQRTQAQRRWRAKRAADAAAVA